MNEWRLSSQTIGGFVAVENIHNMNKGVEGAKAEFELCLPCEHGEVFEYGGGFWSAIVITPYVANEIARRLGKVREYQPGDEALFRFPQVDLKWVLDLLNVSPSTAVRVRQAEMFGRR